MAETSKYEKYFIIFLEAGFIAVNHADEDSAIKLFKAAELCNPKNLLPKIGMGYLHLHKLELKAAAAAFQEVLKKDPSNDMAKAFMGLCLSMTPDQTIEGEKVLHETATHTHNADVKRLAESALNFVEKFVKKAPSPVEGPQKPLKKKGH